jgi:tRNA pseudouridine55 synthase
VLVIDKPAGLTSHDVVARLRRILKTKKIGHTGTLDPFATGVLVMLVGKATRLAQFLDKDEKEYEALVRFGYETETGDRTGAVSHELRVASGESEFPSIDAIESILPQFRGEIEQVPPMYSAKKVEGKKLYELARKGIEIERKAVAVKIGALEVFDAKTRGRGDAETRGQGDTGSNSRLATHDLRLKVTCSAGTYIRTLAEDIARAAGSAAHLAELRRTRAGKFGLDRAITLEELEKMEDPALILRPMNEAISHLPEMKLTADETAKIRNGIVIPASPDLADVLIVRLTGAGDELIAIASHGKKEGVIRPRLVF